MSDDKMKVGLELEVKATGEDQIKKIDNDLQNIERRAKAIATSIRAAAGISPSPGRGKAGADPVRAARDALGIDRDRLRVLKMQMGFETKARADLERAARQQARGDERRYRLSMAFNDRLFRQQRTEQARADRAESNARARQARDTEQVNRRQIAFTGRMFAQRAREEAASERDRERADRQRIRLENYRMRLREREDSRIEREQASARTRFRSRGRDAVEHGRDAYHRLTRPPAYAAAAGAAGTAAVARRALGAEVDVDSAEIDARIYGGLSKDAARQLRDRWAAPLAESLGVGTAKLLTSYTDALKLGIPEAGAKAFSELATKTSEAWGLPFEAVTDTLGTVNSILTSTGEAFDFNKIKSVANTLQYLAAKQSTTPQKMVEYLRQGAGGAAVLGMSQEAGLAFGSASTSLGNQAGESGRLIDYTASRLIELPNLVKNKGDQGKHARGLVRDLSYGSASEMDAQRRVDPDKFFFDFFDRLSKIADPRRQEEAMRFFFGREWLGEGGRIVKGNEKLQEARKLQLDAKNTDAIEEVWSLHKQKLSFVLKRIRTGFVNILGEFGKVLSPLATQFGDYFLDWSRKLQGGGLKARINAVIEGFIAGLGFQDLPDLLRGFFGTPGQGDPGAVAQWKATSKAFAEGIRDVFGSVKSVIGAFTGGDPEVIARWTGRILALSAALFVLGPVLTVLGGFVALIQAVAASVAAVAAIKGAAGVAGAGAASGLAGAAIWTTIGGVIGTAILAKIANSLGILTAPDTSKGYGRAFVEFLDPGLARRLFGDDKPKSGRVDGDTPSSWQDPPARSDRRTTQERQLDELARLRKLAEDAAKTEKESTEKRDSLSGLLHKSSLDDAAANQWTRFSKGQIDRLQDGLNRIPNEARSTNTGSWRGDVSGGPLSGSVGGGALGESGLSRRGILGGGVTTPSGSAAATFGQKAPGLMTRLQSEFGLTREQAAGVLGNLGHESAGFTAHQEGNPLGGGRGGAGWAQWTGPRRRAFEAWAGQRGLDPRSDEANFGFLRHELTGTHAHALRNLKQAGSVEEATRVFERDYEAAGVKHMDRRYGYARQAYGADGSTAAGGNSSSAGAVDVARKFMGYGEHNGGRGALESFMGRSITGRANAWCAAFVNSSLEAIGQKGTGSAVANSFLNWGKAVDPSQVQKGDVAVEHRGRGANNPGGHVGMATGNTRMGQHGLEIEVIQGNSSDQVKTEWERASGLAIRRSIQGQITGTARAAASAMGAIDIGDGMTSTGWKKSDGMGQTTPLGGTTPLRNEKIQTPAPVGGRGGSGGSGGGGAAPIININGVNGDPESLANAVQRRLQEGMNRRSHDVDHIYT